MTQQEARSWIEERFRPLVDRDIRPWALELDPTFPPDVVARVNGRLWTRFSADWADVFPNPGGTAGHHHAFLQAKLAFALALAQEAPDLPARENACLHALGQLWREWAGYQVTSREDLPVALDV